MESKPVILFLHGILGCPAQFAPYIKAIEGKYQYENAVLPGHGAGAREFARSGMAQWQAFADDRIRALKAGPGGVIVCGHSLGCLLAADYASREPQGVRALFFVAAPLVIRVRARCVITSAKIALGIKGGPKEAAARRFCGVDSRISPWQALWGARFIELIKKSRDTRALMAQLHMPIYAMQPLDDEMVGAGAQKHLRRAPQMRLRILERSSHFDLDARDEQYAVNEFLDFINDITILGGKLPCRN